jgi:hypothetical protein
VRRLLLAAISYETGWRDRGEYGAVTPTHSEKSHGSLFHVARKNKILAGKSKTGGQFSFTYDRGGAALHGRRPICCLARRLFESGSHDLPVPALPERHGKQHRLRPPAERSGFLSPQARRSQLRRDISMRTYREALELALMSARNARLTSDKQTARELWKMAQEYQTEAAKLGDGGLPDLGDPPRGIEGLQNS